MHPTSRKKELNSDVSSNVDVVYAHPVSTTGGRTDSTAMSSTTAAIPHISTLRELLYLEFFPTSINLVAIHVPGVQFMPFAAFQMKLSSFLILRQSHPMVGVAR